MSARDELVHYIGEHGGVQPHIVDHLLDAYAHELAEKIRNSQIEESGSGVRCCGTMLSMAADVIEPEVSS